MRKRSKKAYEIEELKVEQEIESSNKTKSWWDFPD